MLAVLKRWFAGAAAADADDAADAPVAPNGEAVPVPAAENVADATATDTHLSGWFNEASDELFTGFAIHRDDAVLDIGCGEGAFVHFCAARGPELFVADIDGEKIARVVQALRGSAARAVHPLVTDAQPIPLTDGRVNKIIAMEVLEHVDDPAQFMRELYRVGTPGARYLITVPDPLGERVQQVLAPPSYFAKPNHIHVFAHEEFADLVTDAGLVIEQRASYGFYWSIWWFFFWACKQDLAPPWHPLLSSWTRTWNLLLATADGPRIKKALDETMPKSQAIIARKPG